MKIEKINLKLNSNKVFLPSLILAGMFFAFSFSSASATTYFVSPAGNDSNSGTETKPFKTLKKANSAMSGGDTVIVEDGVYQSNGNEVLRITKSGTASNYTTFKARNVHNAIIDGSNFINHSCVVVSSNVNYVKIEGFTIRRAKHRGIGITANSSGVAPHHIHIYNNVIQYIGQYTVTDPNDKQGRSGIYTSPWTRHITVDSNIFTILVGFQIHHNNMLTGMITDGI